MNNTKIAKLAQTAKYHADKIAKRLHLVKGNSKIGKKRTLAYSTMPGAGLPTWKDGRVIVDCEGTCAGVCSACSKHCYAMAALRRFANTCAISWADNTITIRENPARIYADIAAVIRRRRSPLDYVRFHVAGEFMPGDAGREELYQLWDLALDYPGVIFYGYTKRTALLQRVEDERGEMPANLVIMASMWRNAEGVESVTNYTNAPEFHYHDPATPAADLEAMRHCPAVDRNGNETGVTCEQCGYCQHARKGDKIAVYAH